MIKLFIVTLLIIILNVSCESTEDVDSIVDYLLNGRVSDVNIESADDKISSEGIWKCGNCSDLGNPYLMDVSDFDDDDVDEAVGGAEKKMTINLNKMRCVTVTSATKGVVLHLTGSCAGPEVTLTFSTSKRYVVRAYQ